MNRIVVIALTLIIGSPNCWCCFGARAAVDAASQTSCCVLPANTTGHCPVKQGGDSTPSSGKSCACDSVKAAREVASSDFMVPPASPFFVIAPPLAFVLDCDSLSYSALDRVMSHAPPGHTRPIFERDCALRL